MHSIQPGRAIARITQAVQLSQVRPDVRDQTSEKAHRNRDTRYSNRLPKALEPTVPRARHDAQQQNVAWSFPHHVDPQTGNPVLNEIHNSVPRERSMSIHKASFFKGLLLPCAFPCRIKDARLPTRRHLRLPRGFPPFTKHP